MNRLVLDKAISHPAKALPESHETYDFATLDYGNDCRKHVVPHATVAPIHYEPNYKYPLLVWLHGDGSNEHEIRQIMPQISMRNYVAVAPQGCWSDAPRHGRYGWRQALDMIEDAESRIADCVAAATRRYNIHPERIFLAGHGAGGTMAFRVAWNNPSKFAAVISVNGPLPTQQAPLRRVNELRQLPCLLATSRESRFYPSRKVCEDLRPLHAAGCTVAMRQYPGADGLTRWILADLDRWIMEIVCGAAVVS